MPDARGNFAYVSVGDKIYLIGGDDSGTVRQTMLVYDTVSKTWSVETGPPTSYCGSAAVEFKGFIYVMGGFIAQGSTNEVFRYNIHDKVWETMTGMPAERSSHGAVVMNERIYVLGGRSWDSGWTYHNTVFVYDSTNDYATSTVSPWDTTFDHPGRLDGYMLGDNSAISVKGRIYTFGGMSGTSAFSDAYDEIWIFDPNAKTSGQAWKYLGSMPGLRFSHCIEYIYGYVVTLGGCSEWVGAPYFYPHTDSLYVFVTEYNMHAGPELKTPVTFVAGGSAVINGRIYIFGGNQSGIYGGLNSPCCWSYQR